MPNANPIQGPYSAPARTYHSGPAKYQRIITVDNAMLPFTATGSYAGVIGMSTNDNSNTITLTLADNGTGNGGQMSLSDFSNNIIYDLGVYRISGSLSTGKHVHLFYAY